MADEKTMKPINESESKQDRPKRRYHRRSNKAAKPASEETPAASGGGAGIHPEAQPQP